MTKLLGYAVAEAGRETAPQKSFASAVAMGADRQRKAVEESFRVLLYQVEESFRVLLLHQSDHAHQSFRARQSSHGHPRALPQPLMAEVESRVRLGCQTVTPHRHDPPKVVSKLLDLVSGGGKVARVLHYDPRHDLQGRGR